MLGADTHPGPRAIGASAGVEDPGSVACLDEKSLPCPGVGGVISTDDTSSTGGRGVVRGMDWSEEGRPDSECVGDEGVLSSRAVLCDWKSSSTKRGRAIADRFVRVLTADGMFFGGAWVVGFQSGQ